MAPAASSNLASRCSLRDRAGAADPNSVDEETPVEQRFVNKTVIVTGAGSGIGAGAAKRFAAEGANVVLAGRSRDKLEAIAAGLEPDRVLVQTCDVSDESQVAALMAAAAGRFGGIDVLVSNAGTAVFKDFAETTTADWRETMAIDLDGVFFCARAALPHLEKSKGAIVHVASVSGMGGDWKMTAYNAAKGGVVNFTRSLALDLAGRGIRVNAVAPSFTITDMTGDMKDDQRILAKFAERMPLGGPATPDDIAGPILFLASDDARFVTGVILPVDGGVTASNGQPAM